MHARGSPLCCMVASGRVAHSGRVGALRPLVRGEEESALHQGQGQGENLTDADSSGGCAATCMPTPHALHAAPCPPCAPLPRLPQVLAAAVAEAKEVLDRRAGKPTTLDPIDAPIDFLDTSTWPEGWGLETKLETKKW